jgi:hypothetical protein
MFGTGVVRKFCERILGDDATALQESDTITATPSLFGLQEPPTNAQLIDCERRTLAALDGLVARIELIRRPSCSFARSHRADRRSAIDLFDGSGDGVGPSTMSSTRAAPRRRVSPRCSG